MLILNILIKQPLTVFDIAWSYSRGQNRTELDEAVPSMCDALRVSSQCRRLTVSSSISRINGLKRGPARRRSAASALFQAPDVLRPPLTSFDPVLEQRHAPWCMHGGAFPSTSEVDGVAMSQGRLPLRSKVSHYVLTITSSDSSSLMVTSDGCSAWPSVKGSP